jgi:hypothetical protein
MSDRDVSQSALSEDEESSSDQSSSPVPVPVETQPKQRRQRAQTYSIKQLPTPLFLNAGKPEGEHVVATPVTIESAVRTRGATFTARPLVGKDAAKCELCEGDAVCKVVVRLKAGDDDSPLKVTKRLCKRCALQQQEFASTLKIADDDGDRLRFLTQARAWSDLARQKTALKAK